MMIIGLRLWSVCIIVHTTAYTTLTKEACIQDEALRTLGEHRIGPQGQQQPMNGIVVQMLKRSERLMLAKQTETSYFHMAIRNCSNEQKSLPDYCGHSLCTKSQNATLLWSFPGSGNTFVRALTESATRVRTGSVMFDRDIAKKMPGELLHLDTAAECEKVSIIKAHPNIKHLFSMDCGFPVYPHCNRGITRAIFLVRHPFSASWAEFQRRTFDGHTNQAPIISKNANWWKSWSILGPQQIHGWTYLWRGGGPFREWMSAYGVNSYHIVRFEDLMLDKVREIELQSMLDFAGLGHLTTAASVACAFSSDLVNAFHRKAKSHRRLAQKHNDAEDITMGILEPNDLESNSAHEAWLTLGKSVCDSVWSIVEPVAVLLGYTRNIATRKEQWTSRFGDVDEMNNSLQERRDGAAVPEELLLSGFIDWAKDRVATSSFPFLILTFINAAYVDVLVNQFLAMMHFDNNLPIEIGVICTDVESRNNLEEFGAPPCYLLETTTEELSNLWEIRIKMLSLLIDNNISVLLTDADAVWQRDPREDLKQYLVSESSAHSKTLVDVVAQRGSFPRNVYKDWGATLCMGFAAFRATAGTKKMLRLIAQVIRSKHDDQVAINSVLHDKLYFDLKFGRRLQYKYSKSIDFGFGRYEGTAIRIALLPEKFYVRRGCKGKMVQKSLTDSIIIHCLSAKTGDSKLENLAHTKTLYFKNETAYRKVLTDRSSSVSFTERLQSIANR